MVGKKHSVVGLIKLLCQKLKKSAGVLKSENAELSARAVAATVTHRGARIHCGTRAGTRGHSHNRTECCPVGSSAQACNSHSQKHICNTTRTFSSSIRKDDERAGAALPGRVVAQVAAVGAVAVVARLVAVGVV